MQSEFVSYSYACCIEWDIIHSWNDVLCKKFDYVQFINNNLKQNVKLIWFFAILKVFWLDENSDWFVEALWISEIA